MFSLFCVTETEKLSLYSLYYRPIMKVSENKVTIRIFGHKKEEINGRTRKTA
jgi:hypothetical protein